MAHKKERYSTGGAVVLLARWVALGALFLLPLTPLLVTNSLFFPFITGKAFYFRILVECVVAAWIVLAFMDRAYRPRLSGIGAIVIAFVAWMAVADACAVNPLKAYWSNFERMEGWVLLIHLLGFFFASSAVLRVEKKWRAWFLTMVAVSAVVAGYALLQLAGTLAIHQGSTRIDATLGNSAYLAIYLLFTVCVAAWLALTETRASVRYALLSLAVIEGILIFYTETRGTVIALTLGLVLSAVLTLATGGKRVRGWAALGLTLVLFAAGGIYAVRDSSFVQQHPTLQRVTSISLQDGQVRFTLWHMALQGFEEHPLLGWGQEGYNYVFNAFYDPSLYHQEQWFDRAHGTFIDWLVAGGVPAFLLYIALFTSGVFFLWRRSTFSRPERIALTAALVGYAVHNVFVFDNLVSYVYFFAILGLIDSQVARPIRWLENAPEIDAVGGTTYLLPIAGVCAVAVIWVVNIPGLQVASGLIDALSASSVEDAYTAFANLAAHPAFAAQEVREQLVNTAASLAANTQVTADEKQRFAGLAVSEMQKQVAAYPSDAREHLQLAYVYRAYGDAASALKEMKVAEQLSPRKIDLLLTIGTTEWDVGDMNAAQAYFEKAAQLAPQFPDLSTYVAAGDILLNRPADADAALMTAYGTTTVDADLLSFAYYHAKQWDRLVTLWQLRTRATGASAQTWFSLAAAYYAAGDSSAAVRTLQFVGENYPDTKASVTEAIRQINTGAPIK